MPEVTHAWIESLDETGIESVLALGRYNRQAMLLFVDVDHLFHTVTGETKLKENEQQEAFSGYFIPYFQMWSAMVYVVHEGLIMLDVEDRQLDKLRADVNMFRLKQARHATFHFRPRWKDPDHAAIFGASVNINDIRALFERQDNLVRRMIRFTKRNPLSQNMML